MFIGKKVGGVLSIMLNICMMSVLASTSITLEEFSRQTFRLNDSRLARSSTNTSWKNTGSKYYRNQQIDMGSRVVTFLSRDSVWYDVSGNTIWSRSTSDSVGWENIESSGETHYVFDGEKVLERVTINNLKNTIGDFIAIGQKNIQEFQNGDSCIVSKTYVLDSLNGWNLLYKDSIVSTECFNSALDAINSEGTIITKNSFQYPANSGYVKRQSYTTRISVDSVVPALTFDYQCFNEADSLVVHSISTNYYANFPCYDNVFDSTVVYCKDSLSGELIPFWKHFYFRDLEHNILAQKTVSFAQGQWRNYDSTFRSPDVLCEFLWDTISGAWLPGVYYITNRISEDSLVSTSLVFDPVGQKWDTANSFCRATTKDSWGNVLIERNYSWYNGEFVISSITEKKWELLSLPIVNSHSQIDSPKLRIHSVGSQIVAEGSQIAGCCIYNLAGRLLYSKTQEPASVLLVDEEQWGHDMTNGFYLIQIETSSGRLFFKQNFCR